MWSIPVVKGLLVFNIEKLTGQKWFDNRFNNAIDVFISQKLGSYLNPLKINLGSLPNLFENTYVNV